METLPPPPRGWVGRAKRIVPATHYIHVTISISARILYIVFCHNKEFVEIHMFYFLNNKNLLSWKNMKWEEREATLVYSSLLCINNNLFHIQMSKCTAFL